MTSSKLISDDVIAPELGAYSGAEGAPMMSKFGTKTIPQFLCFSKKELKEDPGFDHDFGHFDINKVPTELIQEKLKLELLGDTTDIIKAHFDKGRLENEAKAKAMHNEVSPNKKIYGSDHG
jgi:hypothetical protein